MTSDSPLYLDAYAVGDVIQEIAPARPRRDWMNAFIDKSPYRCLPMTMANSTGWEILCPFDIDVEWNGGPNNEDLKISSPDKDAFLPHHVVAHFRKGILTFHVGFVFRTPPGWAIWAMGPPNWPKDGIYPLSGLVETDWLPFSFSMNWQFTRPCKVRFNKGDPYCFITLTEHHRLEDIKPKIRRLDSNKKLKTDFENWAKSREEFNARLHAGDEAAKAEGWQRHYMRGQKVDGKTGSEDHLTKRRLQKPRDLRGNALFNK